MDAHDFAMPSPKRQRTESPEPTIETNPSPSTAKPLSPKSRDFANTTEPSNAVKDSQNVAIIPGLSLSNQSSDVSPVNPQAPVAATTSNTILDALMLHVESISQSVQETTATEISPKVANTEKTHQPDPIRQIKESSDNTTEAQPISGSIPQSEDSHVIPIPTNKEVPPCEPAIHAEDPKFPTSEGDTGGSLPEQDQTMVDSQPEPERLPAYTEGVARDDGEQIAGMQLQPPTESTNAEGPEWEVDSSPYASSDSDSSDTTSDDSDDDDADGDYAMLDPEEQARILMAGDGGSDDEGDKRGKPDGGHLRTANEKVEEIIPKPDIAVTEDMQIEELGTVEGVVEKTVLIKAKVSGEYQVLESNSLLCLADRSVVGVIAEPLGRVEQPMYTIRFTNDEAIKEAGLAERGTKVFYVAKHSTFVFTQPLKAVKGSDASNFHDEEVGDDEMEFSDDEAEAEHKRQMKLKRQGRREDGGGRGRGRGGRANFQRGGRQDFRHSNDGSSLYGGGSSEISYDDVAEGADEGYTPLARPANLSEMMAGIPREPTEESHFTSKSSDRTRDLGLNRGRGRGRGRGDRGHRGGRGGRGGGGNQPSWVSHQSESPAHTTHQTQLSPQSMLPPQFPYPNFPQQQLHLQPGQPHLSPQHQTFSPSPITPLGSNPFNFNFQQQQHAQQQWHGAQPFSQFGPPQMFPPPQSQHHRQGQFEPNAWNASQAAAAAQAQVAAHLEQLRRNEGQ